MPPAQMAQCPTVAPAHRQRADDAALRQMLHQAKEPGQLRRIHALFVQRQNEIARGGAQRVVAVLHTLGDAAERHHAADIVVCQERGQRLVGDLGVDRHAGLGHGGGMVENAGLLRRVVDRNRRALCRRSLAGNDRGGRKKHRPAPESLMPARLPYLQMGAARRPARRSAAAAGRVRADAQPVRAALPGTRNSGGRGEPRRLPDIGHGGGGARPDGSRCAAHGLSGMQRQLQGRRRKEPARRRRQRGGRTDPRAGNGTDARQMCRCSSP